MTGNDTRYGRRGGRWAAAPGASIPRCACGRALLKSEVDRGSCADCAPPADADQPSLFGELSA